MSDFNQNWNWSKSLSNLHAIKFHKNLFRDSLILTCRQVDRFRIKLLGVILQLSVVKTSENIILFLETASHFTGKMYAHTSFNFMKYLYVCFCFIICPPNSIFVGCTSECHMVQPLPARKFLVYDWLKEDQSTGQFPNYWFVI